MSRSTRIRGRSPDGIDGHITNYKLAGSHRDEIRELIGEFDGRGHQLWNYLEYHCAPVLIRYGFHIVPLSRHDICDSHTLSWSSSRI